MADDIGQWLIIRFFEWELYGMAERPTSRIHRGSDRPVHTLTLEDAELIERVKTGETQAYSKLVLKYQDRIFNTCLRICGHQQDAQDITQDAFIKAFEKLQSFRHESAFTTWLFRIATNLAISHLRSVKRKPLQSLNGNFEAMHTQADELIHRTGKTATPDAVETALASELQQSVVTVLYSLDDDHRAVVVLRDMEGFSYDEIANILDIPTGTVKSRLFRARMMLRDRILAEKNETGS